DRLLVRGCRGDVDVLAAAPLEQLEVASDLVGRERAEVRDDVERLVADRGGDRRGVAVIAREVPHALDARPRRARAAVEQGELVAAGDHAGARRRADDAV